MFEEFASYSYINFSDIIFENELGRTNVSVFKGKLNSNDIAIKIYEVDTETNYINENIINELYIGKIINSERLLKIIGYSYNDDETEYYLIMEYINYGSLFDYINKSTNYNIVLHNFRETNHRIINPYLHDGKKKGNKLNYIMSDKVKFSIVISLLKAARSMYDNKIIHGDMKTDNVVIQKENSNI